MRPKPGNGRCAPATVTCSVRRPVEHLPPRGARHVGIGVENQGRIEPRHLDRCDMHDVAPDQQALAARLQQPVGVARRVSGPQHRGDAGKHLAVPDAADAIPVGRRDAPLRRGIVADPLGIVRQHRAIEPERSLFFMNDDLGLGKHRPAHLVHQPERMVGMQMGEQKHVDVFRRGARGAQVFRQLAERRLQGRPRSRIAQHQSAAAADEVGIHVEPHRLAGLHAAQPFDVGALDADQCLEAAAIRTVGHCRDGEIADLAC